VEREHHFRAAFDCDERPRIANVAEVFIAINAARFFRANERPDFIDLNILYRNVRNLGRQELLALFAGRKLAAGGATRSEFPPISIPVGMAGDGRVIFASIGFNAPLDRQSTKPPRAV
jgi:hypothetical protein